MWPKQSLLWPSIALQLASSDAQGLKTVAIGPGGTLCPAPTETTVIQPVFYSQFFQSASRLHNFFNQGDVDITEGGTFITSVFNVTNVFSTIATVTVTENPGAASTTNGDNSVDPNLTGTQSTSSTGASVSGTGQGTTGPPNTASSSGIKPSSNVPGTDASTPSGVVPTAGTSSGGSGSGTASGTNPTAGTSSGASGTGGVTTGTGANPTAGTSAATPSVTPEATFDPVEPPATTPSPSPLLTFSTVGADGLTTEVIEEQPTFTLGNDPAFSGTVSSIAPTAPVIIAVAIPLPGLRVKRQSNSGALAFGFSEGNGGKVGGNCGNSVRYYIGDGKLLDTVDNNAVGRNQSSGFALITPNQYPSEIETAFTFIDGILRWVTSDRGEAEFYQCPDGKVYAGHEGAPQPGCFVVILGAVKASACKADYRQSGDPGATTTTVNVATTASNVPSDATTPSVPVTSGGGQSSSQAPNPATSNTSSAGGSGGSGTATVAPPASTGGASTDEPVSSVPNDGSSATQQTNVATSDVASSSGSGPTGPNVEPTASSSSAGGNPVSSTPSATGIVDPSPTSPSLPSSSDSGPIDPTGPSPSGEPATTGPPAESSGATQDPTLDSTTASASQDVGTTSAGGQVGTSTTGPAEPEPTSTAPVGQVTTSADVPQGTTTVDVPQPTTTADVPQGTTSSANGGAGSNSADDATSSSAAAATSSSAADVASSSSAAAASSSSAADAATSSSAADVASSSSAAAASSSSAADAATSSSAADVASSSSAADVASSSSAAAATSSSAADAATSSSAAADTSSSAADAATSSSAADAASSSSAADAATSSSAAAATSSSAADVASSSSAADAATSSSAAAASSSSAADATSSVATTSNDGLVAPYQTPNTIADVLCVGGNVFGDENVAQPNSVPLVAGANNFDKIAFSNAVNDVYAIHCSHRSPGTQDGEDRRLGVIDVDVSFETCIQRCTAYNAQVPAPAAGDVCVGVYWRDNAAVGGSCFRQPASVALPNPPELSVGNDAASRRAFARLITSTPYNGRPAYTGIYDAVHIMGKANDFALCGGADSNNYDDSFVEHQGFDNKFKPQARGVQLISCNGDHYISDTATTLDRTALFTTYGAGLDITTADDCARLCSYAYSSVDDGVNDAGRCTGWQLSTTNECTLFNGLTSGPGNSFAPRNTATVKAAGAVTRFKDIYPNNAGGAAVKVFKRNTSDLEYVSRHRRNIFMEDMKADVIINV